jgi:hemolysin D
MSAPGDLVPGRQGGTPPLPGQRRTRPAVIDIAGPALPRADRDPGDREFLPPAIEIIEAPPSRLRAILGYLICGLLTAGLAGACIGQLPIYAIAPGQVTASGQAKVIEPRQAGQVLEIRAENGAHVKKGDVLVELDPTDALATRTIVANQLVNARAEAARFTAEIAAAQKHPVAAGAQIRWPRDIPAAVRQREQGLLHADLARLAATLADLTAERREKASEKDKFAAGVAAEKAVVAILSRHADMHRQLAREGVESRLELLDALDKLETEETKLATLAGSLGDATAALAVIDAEIRKARADFIGGDTQQLAAAERQIDTLTQQLKKASQTVTEMTLRAPITGTVEASAVTTVGQIVKPGQQLMQLVPDKAPLEIEAYVLNSDIGFVRAGDPATIMIDTFPYPRYGTITGKVITIGKDAISGKAALLQEENGSQPISGGGLSQTAAAESTSDLVFPVKIILEKYSINVSGKPVSLSSGMSAVVEIETGKQRVIDYIMYPLLRGFSRIIGR